MTDIELDKLVSQMSDAKIGKNAESLTEMIKQADTFVAGVQKITDRLNSMGILPAIVRGIGKKMNIDVETPLKTGNSIIPQSEAHEALINAINGMGTEELAEFSKRLINGNPKS